MTRHRPALFAILVLHGVAATAAPPTLPIDIAADRLHQADMRLVTAGASAEPLTIDPAVATLARATDDGIAVAPVLADAPRDRAEALALAALLHGYWDRTAASPRTGAAATMAAIAATIGGMAADPIGNNRDFQADRDRRSAGLGAQAYPNPTPDQANGAVRAVALLTAAGGCTAPLLAMLGRLRNLSDSPRQDERLASLFATRVTRDLGVSAYAPDASCRP